MYTVLHFQSFCQAFTVKLRASEEWFEEAPVTGRWSAAVDGQALICPIPRLDRVLFTYLEPVSTWLILYTELPSLTKPTARRRERNGDFQAGYDCRDGQSSQTLVWKLRSFLFSPFLCFHFWLYGFGTELLLCMLPILGDRVSREQENPHSEVPSRPHSTYATSKAMRSTHRRTSTRWLLGSRWMTKTGSPGWR